MNNPYRVGILIFLAACALSTGVIYGAQLVGLRIAILGGLNCGALRLCGFDKLQARRGSLRVPEVVLYGAALAGGALGLLAGMRLFRHKTSKASFQFYLVLILGLQIVVLKSLVQWNLP